jgi:erythritol kinase
MAGTLNIDWILNLACDLLSEFGTKLSQSDRVKRIDGWLQYSRPGAHLYHPYISDAGERGPFVNTNARASFIGLTSESRFPDLLRAVIEGLGMAARDCYAAMGGAMPAELRLTGGATRSRALRSVLGAVVGAPVRISMREEAGAAGAAMMAAVALGVYPDMQACIAEWVTPLLGQAEAPDPELMRIYAQTFPVYQEARRALEPVWEDMARQTKARRYPDALPSSTKVEPRTAR